MPLGMSEAPLSKAELAQLDKKVQSWRKFKVGREVVKKVEGIVFGVERDELRGPPATLTSTYVVLWDTEGKNCRGKSPLANLIPGDEGVEQEIVAGEVLAAGSTVTMRAAFSHPELMLPLKQLQEHRWSWKAMPPQKQRLLLEWTPMNEHAERQKRHKEMADEVLKEMRKEREKGATAPGGAPRRDRPGGRARAAAAGGGKGSRTKAQLAAHSKIEGEEPDDEPEDEAMQDAVSGSEDRFTDADEGALPGAEGEWEDFSPQGQPPPRLTPRQQPKQQQQQPARKPAAAGGRAASKGNAAVGAAGGSAAAAKAGGKRPSSGSGGGTSGGRAKQASAGGAAAVPGGLFSSDEEAGHPALEDMVQLPPGSEPPSVPVSLTLTAGDKLLQEYKDQRFAPDEEFEPEHIVSQRPPGQPREFLCKWRNYELDPTDWSDHQDLAETTALDAWEKKHPPPQGAGKPPPPLQPELIAKKGSAKRKRKL